MTKSWQVELIERRAEGPAYRYNNPHNIRTNLNYETVPSETDKKKETKEGESVRKFIRDRARRKTDEKDERKERQYIR